MPDWLLYLSSDPRLVPCMFHLGGEGYESVGLVPLGDTSRCCVYYCILATIEAGAGWNMRLNPRPCRGRAALHCRLREMS